MEIFENMAEESAMEPQEDVTHIEVEDLKDDGLKERKFKVNPKDLLIYSEIMKPKFMEE